MSNSSWLVTEPDSVQIPKPSDKAFQINVQDHLTYFFLHGPDQGLQIHIDKTNLTPVLSF